MLEKPSTAPTGVPSGRVKGNGQGVIGAEDEARAVDQKNVAGRGHGAGGGLCGAAAAPGRRSTKRREQ